MKASSCLLFAVLFVAGASHKNFASAKAPPPVTAMVEMDVTASFHYFQWQSSASVDAERVQNCLIHSFTKAQIENDYFMQKSTVDVPSTGDRIRTKRYLEVADGHPALESYRLPNYDQSSSRNSSPRNIQGHPKSFANTRTEDRSNTMDHRPPYLRRTSQQPEVSGLKKEMNFLTTVLPSERRTSIQANLDDRNSEWEAEFCNCLESWECTVRVVNWRFLQQ